MWLLRIYDSNGQDFHFFKTFYNFRFHSYNRTKLGRPNQSKFSFFQKFHSFWLSKCHSYSRTKLRRNFANGPIDNPDGAAQINGQTIIQEYSSKFALVSD